MIEVRNEEAATYTEAPADRLLRSPKAMTDAELVAEVAGIDLEGRTLAEAFAESSTLQSVEELMHRRLGERLERDDALTNPQAALEYVQTRLARREHEVFAVVFVDNRHRVIAFEEMFRGTVDGSTVHSREVVKAALSHNAAAVVLVHNHPSGVAEPSKADHTLTQRLTDALALVDIRVLDHFVLAHSESTSFAQRGLI